MSIVLDRVERSTALTIKKEELQQRRRSSLALVARSAAALEGFLAEAVLAVGQRDALATFRPSPAGVARALPGFLASSVHAPFPTNC